MATSLPQVSRGNHARMVDQSYLNAIKQFEGYTAEARWDYAQNSNGYGTRARYAGEVIDKAEAEKRFSDAVSKAADFVDKFAPNLDVGSKAALTSLTYNAGTAWAQSGLGQAVANGDLDKARSLFLQYNKAGGAVVDGLVQRRLQEVAWFGGATPAAQPIATSFAAMASSASASAIPAVTSVVNSAPVASRPTFVAAPAQQNADSGPVNSSLPPLSSFAGDQMLLTLLTQISTATAASRDGNKKPDGDADKSRAIPDVHIRVG